ncbi:hypothetical protein ABBQ38_009476 [Trebouxia sp. C0009 RCD-2024]
MSERERHSKRRSRHDEVPDPEDRYDPRQGAKRPRKDEDSIELGHSQRAAKDEQDFSDRYEPQVKPDISERSESTRRSRSKERPSHSSRDHRDNHERRDHESSRSHRRSHHSPVRTASDKQRFTDSKTSPQEPEPRSPRQMSDTRPDHPEQHRAGWQGPDFSGRGRGSFSDRGGFGRGGFAPGRGLGRGRGHFDGPGSQNFNQGGDWGPDGPAGGMGDRGRGRGGFVPRGRFGGFGGRFEGGGGRMDGGRFDASRGRGLPFRGRGGRSGYIPNGTQGDGAAPTPFRGPEGQVEGGRGGPARGGGRGAPGTFPEGGRGGPPASQASRRPFVDPASAERRRNNAEARLRQQVSQLHIASDLVPDRLNDKHQLLLKHDNALDKSTVTEVPVHIASAYMYSAIHSEPVTALAAGKGADRAAFDAAVELYQRPQAAQWTRPSKHGNFILTSVQIMTNV